MSKVYKFFSEMRRKFLFASYNAAKVLVMYLYFTLDVKFDEVELFKHTSTCSF